MKFLSILLTVFLTSAGHILASLDIVWSGQQDIKMGPGSTLDWLPSYATWSLDINGDGNNDLTFGYSQSFTVQTQTGSSVTVSPQPPFSILDSVPLADGTQIGPSSLFAPGTYSMVSWQNIPGVGDFGAGSWAFVTNAYMGVQFTAADGVHYGWVQITSYPDMRAHIHSWAYESQPGVSIEAGMVPEPSTIGLMLLGSGVVGLAAWRRRKQNSASDTI